MEAPARAMPAVGTLVETTYIDHLHKNYLAWCATIGIPPLRLSRPTATPHAAEDCHGAV
jgi:hypothetical protein